MVTGVAGKVLIVTGASGNLGQAVATAAREGAAKVVLAGRSIGSLTRTFPGAEADPNVLLAAEVDLGDLASMQNLANATLAKFGRIDGLLNTVGGQHAHTSHTLYGWHTTARPATRPQWSSQ